MRKQVLSVCCSPEKRVIDSWLKPAGQAEGKRIEREEIVYMHGLSRLGNSTFWRGAKISPNFSS